MSELRLTESYSTDTRSTEATEFPTIVLGPSLIQVVVADGRSVVRTIGEEIHARWRSSGVQSYTSDIMKLSVY